MFITALTSVSHLSITGPAQSNSHSNSWYSILIISTHLRLGLPIILLTSGFPSKSQCNSKHTYKRHVPSPPHSFGFVTSILWGGEPYSQLHLILPRLLVSKHPPENVILKHSQLPSLRHCQGPSFTPIQNNRQNYSSIYYNL